MIKQAPTTIVLDVDVETGPQAMAQIAREFNDAHTARMRREAAQPHPADFSEDFDELLGIRDHGMFDTEFGKLSVERSAALIRVELAVLDETSANVEEPAAASFVVRDGKLSASFVRDESGLHEFTPEAALQTLLRAARHSRID